MIDSSDVSASDSLTKLLTDADEARSSRDWRALIRIGGELERLGSYGEAWSALAEGAELRKGTILPNWGGPGTPAKRLLIRRRIRHLGAELRNARFIACALRDLPDVVVATEARLIPLLQRSFPAAKFIDVEAIGAIEGADVECSYERLACHYGADERAIVNSFVPLVPPPACAPEGIGIAWYSSNGAKSTPAIKDWAGILSKIEQRVQSLQYAENEADLARLIELSGRVILPSMPIDQMIDVDGFASQVASVKAVLTISNTTAHMAGALGVPCVVVLDDIQHLTWPCTGERSPFYPSMRILRQNGRSWADVLDEGVQTLHKLTR